MINFKLIIIIFKKSNNQMEFEESIYNLIPKETYVPPKQPRHKSVHNPLVNPTASTFCLRTTSKAKVSNLIGNE
jgi:hypothetical protein